jgi:hypothetical protein
MAHPRRDEVMTVALSGRRLVERSRVFGQVRSLPVTVRGQTVVVTRCHGDINCRRTSSMRRRNLDGQELHSVNGS